MIVGIHHIAISVEDIDKAVKFYTNAFGFQSVQQENLDNDLQANRVIGMDAIKARMGSLTSHCRLMIWKPS